jgi:16S rRNA (adenine1518-N6/adenine1519-N6)-dimethyltransferase
MSAVGQAMIIDAVDQADVPIGQVPRAEVFEKHLNFRVSHVFVFNAQRELLIQQLAASRPRHAGDWGSSVAAYLFSHEDYRTAASRRMSEELGITGCKLRLVSRDSMNDQGCTKFISLFETEYNGPFRVDHEHISRVQLLPIPIIREMARTGERLFTPTFLHVLNSYQLAMVP